MHNFDKNKLDMYRYLLATTDIQQAYQEFVDLFRFVRIELEKQLPQYNFSSHIVENRLDFAYFQLTDEALKNKGLKIQVVFVHKTYCFEVWVSRYNRQIQQKYYRILKDQTIKYYLNSLPASIDYIFKSTLDGIEDIAVSQEVVVQVKHVVLEIVAFCQQQLL